MKFKAFDAFLKVMRMSRGRDVNVLPPGVTPEVHVQDAESDAAAAPPAPVRIEYDHTLLGLEQKRGRAAEDPLLAEKFGEHAGEPKYDGLRKILAMIAVAKENQYIKFVAFPDLVEYPPGSESVGVDKQVDINAFRKILHAQLQDLQASRPDLTFNFKFTANRDDCDITWNFKRKAGKDFKCQKVTSEFESVASVVRALQTADRQSVFVSEGQEARYPDYDVVQFDDAIYEKPMGTAVDTGETGDLDADCNKVLIIIKALTRARNVSYANFSLCEYISQSCYVESSAGPDVKKHEEPIEEALLKLAQQRYLSARERRALGFDFCFVLSAQGPSLSQSCRWRTKTDSDKVRVVSKSYRDASNNIRPEEFSGGPFFPANASDKQLIAQAYLGQEVFKIRVKPKAQRAKRKGKDAADPKRVTDARVSASTSNDAPTTPKASYLSLRASGQKQLDPHQPGAIPSRCSSDASPPSKKRRMKKLVHTVS